MYEYEKSKLLNTLSTNLLENLKECNAIIAGGAITSIFSHRDISDIDVYFRSFSDMRDFFYGIEGTNARVVGHTDKAALIANKGDHPVQVVCFDTFESPEKVFEKFDFTVCMGAYDFKDDSFHFHDEFFHHNGQRLLKFNSDTAFPIISLLRVEKYKQKGYTISKAEFMRVILSCMNMKINTWESFKAQIGGMYGLNSDQVVKHDEDEVFDLSVAISDFENIAFDDKYFEEKNQPQGLDEDYDLFVARITGEKVPYYRYAGKCFSPICGSSMITDTVDEKVYQEIKYPESIANKIYKYVEKKGERYYSYYDSYFEYVPGDIVVPRYGSLYFVNVFGIKNCKYKSYKNAVLIECELVDDYQPSLDTFNAGSPQFTVSRVRFVREVPKEEAEELENMPSKMISELDNNRNV
jgi:hypothetical protein